MTDKQKTKEKLNESINNLTNLLLSSIEDNQETHKNELVEQINEVESKINTNLSNLIDLPKTIETHISNKTEKISDNLGLKLNEFKEEVLSKLNEDSKSFHEELEKVIDMTAALTVELSSKLDDFQQKIDSFTQSSSDEKSLINELKKEVTAIMDRQAIVFESRIDGLKKQIEDEITPKLDSIEVINSVLNKSTKKINSIESKINSVLGKKEEPQEKEDETE